MTSPRSLKELSGQQFRLVADLSTRAGARAAQSLGMLMGLEDQALHADRFTVGGADAVAEALGPQQALAVMFKLAGGITGRFWLLAPLPDMLVLAGRLLGSPGDLLTTLTEPARGALAEAGNVVSSSFINVFGDTLRQVCFPSVPDVRHAPASLLSRLALDATDVVGLMRISSTTEPQVRATLLWSPDPLSLGKLVELLSERPAMGA